MDNPYDKSTPFQLVIELRQVFLNNPTTYGIAWKIQDITPLTDGSAIILLEVDSNYSSRFLILHADSWYYGND